ncbi:MAG: GTPase [Nanoarchaeota archaeon]
MASTNQSPFYKQAELKFLNSKTNEDKLKWLEEMMRECPKHKSSEKMLANLKTRYVKLKEKIASQRKTSKGSKKPGIKKEEMQAAIIGFTNSGKSSLLSLLTNANPKISGIEFATREPIVGMMSYQGIQIQLVEIPAIESEFYDRSITHIADSIIILIESLSQIQKIQDLMENIPGKKIIAFNKTDLLNNEEKRRIYANLQSKKYNFVMISTETKEGINELKEKLFLSFDRIRVFTKEPGKEKSNNPIILRPGSTIKNIAEKIFKGFASKIKETKIWGPSSKFPGQKVSLNHELKDLDVVEFKTR